MRSPASLDARPPARAIACGWSPFGSNSETMPSGTPPSLFSGRGGRCGTQVLSRNSGRPCSISSESACTVAVTPACGSAADVLQRDVEAGDRHQPGAGALPRRAAPAHRRAARRLQRLLGAGRLERHASGPTASDRRAPSPGASASGRAPHPSPANRPRRKPARTGRPRPARLRAAPAGPRRSPPVRLHWTGALPDGFSMPWRQYGHRNVAAKGLRYARKERQAAGRRVRGASISADGSCAKIARLPDKHEGPLKSIFAVPVES